MIPLMHIPYKWIYVIVSLTYLIHEDRIRSLFLKGKPLFERCMSLNPLRIVLYYHKVTHYSHEIQTHISPPIRNSPLRLQE